MNKELWKELFESIKEDKNHEHHLYDYVANNYWKLSKDDLKDILLEVIACSDTRVDELEIELLDRFPEEDYEEEE